jgi:creatinine amidohydrolase
LNDPQLDFARYSATGVIGDPMHASAALGRKLWEATVEAAVEILRMVYEFGVINTSRNEDSF